jgi:hypothetical protein
MIRTADQKTEHAVSLPITLPKNLDEARGTVLGYVKDEAYASLQGKEQGKGIKVYGDRIKEFRIYKGMFPEVEKALLEAASREEIDGIVAHYQDKILNGIAAQISKDMDSLKEDLMHWGVIGPEINGAHTTHGISNEYTEEGVLTKNALDALLERIIVQQFVGKQEIFKFFLGDPAYYSDLFKRAKGATGTKKMAIVSDYMNRHLNEGPWARINKRSLDGMEDFAVYSDPVVQARMYDAVKELLPDDHETYGKIKKSDGTILMPLPAYREILKRTTVWTPPMEEAFELLMSGKASYVEGGTFPAQKLQEFGPQAWDDGSIQPMSYLKMSVVPIHPAFGQVGKGYHQGIKDLYDHMEGNGLGGIILPTAFKVGVPSETKPLIEDGKVGVSGKTEAPYVTRMDYQFWGMQLDVSSKFKDKVALASQARAHTKSNLFEDGKQVLGDPKDTEHYDNLFNGLTKQAFKGMLKSMGMVRTDDGFIVQDDDYSKFLDVMMDEAIRRDLPKSLQDGLDYLNDANDAQRPVIFDLLVNKQRMEGLLWSIAGKQVIKQRFKGLLAIQVSSLGYEVVKEGDVEVEEPLEAYFNERGERVIEVYMPHTFKEYWDKDVEVVSKGTPGDGVYMNGKKVGEKDLLQAYGIRIPTDAIHSIDIIRIKGFLPRVMGPVVVVPAELVAKTGSDFDIDKLTMYLPSYRFRKGQLVYEEFEDDPSLENWFNKKKQRALERYQELEEIFGVKKKAEMMSSIDKLLNGIFGEERTDRADEVMMDIQEDLAFDIDHAENVRGMSKEKVKLLLDKAAEDMDMFGVSFEDWKDNNPDITIYDVNSKGALQNELMHMMGKLLTLDERFEDLMQPVHMRDLEAVSDLIKEQLPDLDTYDNAEDYHGYTSLRNMIHATRAYFKGAKGVGISALASTHHVKSQQAGLSLKGRTNVILPDGRELPLRLRFDGFTKSQTEISMSRIKDVNGKFRISDVIGQLVNAYVDVVNKPLIHILNAGPEAANAWMFLIRAGVPIKDVAFFMNQPIVHDYYYKNASLNSEFRKALRKRSSRADIIVGLRTDYAADNISNEQLKTSSLQKMLGKDRKGMSPKERGRQLQILDDLLVYEVLGGELSDMVTAQSFDTKPPKNRHHLRLSLRAYDRVLELDHFNNVEQITEGNSFMKSITEYNFDMLSMFNDLFLVENVGEEYQEMYNRMLDTFSDKDKFLSDDDRVRILTKFEEGFIAYLLTELPNPEGTLGSNMLDYMFGENSTAQRLHTLQRTDDPALKELQGNPFIQSLLPILAANREGEHLENDHIEPVQRTMTPYEANIIYDGFKEMEQTHPLWAKRLIRTAILQSGLSQSPTSFIQLIPSGSVMAEFEGILHSYREGILKISPKKYLQRFFQQNWADRRIVPTDNSSSREKYPFVLREDELSRKMRKVARESGKVAPKAQYRLYSTGLWTDGTFEEVNKKGSPTFTNMSSSVILPSNKKKGKGGKPPSVRPDCR